MPTMRSGDVGIPYQATVMPAPVIPIRRTPWFMWALWALAGLLVVGLAYSFWRISSVPTPKLDAPQTPPTISEHAG